MAELTLMKNAAELGLAAEWQQAKSRLPGPAAVREAAFERFTRTGLPHRRVEEWKYTDLRALMRDAKPLAQKPTGDALARAKDAGKALAGLDARRVVVANGHVVPEWSDLTAHDPGLTITEIFSAGFLDKLGATFPDDAAIALNTAFMSGGVAIHVVKDAAIERPIHLAHVFSGDAASAYPRSLVIVEPGARLMLIESFEGPDETDYQINTALEFMIGEGAHVDHIKLNRDGDRAIHVSSLGAHVAARARYNDFTFTTGGAVTRNQLFVRFGGQETVANIRGASLLRGKQHADITLVADHAASNCQSREVFKTVLDGESRGVFQGKIIVRQHAQKTDAKMAAHALLLSEEAEADAKPELEIYADDVQCGHGATAGELDDDLLFYLRARGIPAKEAESLLIQAFVGEAVEGVEDAGLRETLMEHARAWLAARG